jgi:mRNA interferase MazF
MIDKLTAVPRSRISRTIGQADDDLLLRVGRAMALWLGLAA